MGVVGIDTHKATLAACAIDDVGQVLAERIFPNDPAGFTALAGWLGVGFCYVVMMFGELLQLPGWLMDVSPFRHLAQAPAEDFRTAPVVVLIAVTLAVGAAGLTVLRRRDVVSA